MRSPRYDARATKPGSRTLRFVLTRSWLGCEKMEEDGPAHQFMKMPAVFDEALVAQLNGPPLREFRHRTVIYSEPAIYTMDNPFFLSAPGEEGLLLVPLTPHHLLVCSDDQPPSDLDALGFLQPFPYISFSTKLFSS